mmetsp:Transcript_37462/g.88163  ORF Transcript_37462/g.88163 Transcript_37462/m.88163 type:complete len:239 (+) Transcript_37462:772-1488(+)
MLCCGGAKNIRANREEVRRHDAFHGEGFWVGSSGRPAQSCLHVLGKSIPMATLDARCRGDRGLCDLLHDCGGIRDQRGALELQRVWSSAVLRLHVLGDHDHARCRRQGSDDERWPHAGDDAAGVRRAAHFALYWKSEYLPLSHHRRHKGAAIRRPVRPDFALLQQRPHGVRADGAGFGRSVPGHGGAVGGRAVQPRRGAHRPGLPHADLPRRGDGDNVRRVRPSVPHQPDEPARAVRR